MSSSPSGSATIGALRTSSSRDLLAVTGVRVREPVPRVLHLDLREVLTGRAEQLHPAAGVQAEVRGIGRAEQPEAQPVGVVATLALVRREKSLRGRVGADDERDVAEAGEDLGASGRQRGDPRCARRIRRRDLGAVPSECLRERCARDVSRVAVAHRVGAGHELDVAPFDGGVGERGLRGDHAVVHEVPAPLAPWVHARAEHGDVPVGRHRVAPCSGAHCHTTYSWSSSS